MRTSLLASGALLLAAAAVHSAMGEARIFRKGGDSVPRQPPGQTPLECYRGILRASWHIASVLGAALGLLLLLQAAGSEPMPRFVQSVTATAAGASAAAVLWWTKGRHPGWVALAVAALLCAMA